MNNNNRHFLSTDSMRHCVHKPFTDIILFTFRKKPTTMGTIFYLHFWDEEAEVRGGWVTYWGSHSLQVSRAGFGPKSANATGWLLAIVLDSLSVALWRAFCFRSSTLKLLVKMTNCHEIMLLIFASVISFYHTTQFLTLQKPQLSDDICLLCWREAQRLSYAVREKDEDSNFSFFLLQNQSLFVVRDLEMISTKNLHMVVTPIFKGGTGTLLRAACSWVQCSQFPAPCHVPGRGPGIKKEKWSPCSKGGDDHGRYVKKTAPLCVINLKLCFIPISNTVYTTADSRELTGLEVPPPLEDSGIRNLSCWTFILRV